VEPRCHAGVQAFKSKRKEERMRGWTLGVSIVIHLCIITGVIVKPLFATDELPVPPRVSEWVMVVERIPAPPRDPSPVKPTSGNVAPLDAPDAVTPEPPTPAPVSPGPTDFDVPGGDPFGGPFVPIGVISAGDPLPPPPSPPPPAAPVKPFRVGGEIRPPQRIHHVAPRYPAIAQASRVEGVVILEAVIEEDGSVRDVRVLKSKQLLEEAAIEAVRQWRFTPTMLNGQPVPVVMTVTVSFTLN
jgi:protein TonB